jgi:transposase
MSHITELVKKIVEEKQPTVNITVREIADELSRRLDKEIHPMQVKRILNDLGIFAEEGKKRSWVWRHNPNKAE